MREPWALLGESERLARTVERLLGDPGLRRALLLNGVRPGRAAGLALTRLNPPFRNAATGRRAPTATKVRVRPSAYTCD